MFPIKNGNRWQHVLARLRAARQGAYTLPLRAMLPNTPQKKTSSSVTPPSYTMSPSCSNKHTRYSYSLKSHPRKSSSTRSEKRAKGKAAGPVSPVCRDVTKTRSAPGHAMLKRFRNIAIAVWGRGGGREGPNHRAPAQEEGLDRVYNNAGTKPTTGPKKAKSLPGVCRSPFQRLLPVQTAAFRGAM